MKIVELTPFISPEQFFIVGLIIFLSLFIYSTIGFGAGMIAVSLAGLYYGKLEIFVPLLLLLTLPAEVVISIKDRKFLDFRKLGFFVALSLPTMFAGALLLKSYSTESWILALMGLIITALALYFLKYDRNAIRLKGSFWKYLMGLISGLLGGIYGIGGPPMIIYFKVIQLEKSEFRVTLLSIFLFMAITRFGIYLFMGFYNRELFMGALSMVPFMLLGLVSGMILHGKISEKRFRMLTSLFLLVCGLLLILKKTL